MCKQGRSENSEARGQKRRMRPPASEVSRKFPRSRNHLCKITTRLLYETPQTLKHLLLRGPPDLEAFVAMRPPDLEAFVAMRPPRP